MIEPTLYYLDDDEIIPNSYLPVLYYPKAMELPLLFPSRAMTQLFSKNNWTNNEVTNIYTINHYHSVTHKSLGVIKGNTELLLGGVNGVIVPIQKGDVIIIPAGVAHKNLGKEYAVVCVTGYPESRIYDMNYCKRHERPRTKKNIAALPLPLKDPVFGSEGPLVRLWQQHNGNPLS